MRLWPRAMNRGEILSACSRHFPLCFYFSHRSRSNSCPTEISQQNTLFSMQTVNKKGEKDSLCKTCHVKCFRTKIFDRFHQEMSRRRVFRIPLQIPNSNLYAIYNFWLHVSIFTLICENTLLLSCMDKEEKCLSKDR